MKSSREPDLTTASVLFLKTVQFTLILKSFERRTKEKEKTLYQLNRSVTLIQSPVSLKAFILNTRFQTYLPFESILFY